MNGLVPARWLRRLYLLAAVVAFLPAAFVVLAQVGRMLGPLVPVVGPITRRRRTGA